MRRGRHVTVVGRDVLERRLAALPHLVDAAALRSVQGETVAVAADMRRGAPIKTGALRDGIQAEINASQLEGIAASTAEHSKYVVHGTSRMEAQDFITPAAELSRRRFPRRVRAETLKDLRKISK